MDLTTLNVGDLINTGAWIFIAVLFVKGEIVARSVMEKMMKHGRDQSKVVAQSVTDGIKEAVKQGILEANYELNGKKKRK